MSELERYAKWTDAAWALEQPKEALPVPYNTLMGEALDVLRFAQRHWRPAETTSGQRIRIGLSSAVGNGLFGPKIVDELRELYEATQAANTEYRLTVSKQAAPAERAQFVLGEIKATLDWYFDDGEQAEEDAQLEALAEVHAEAHSHDAIASALFDYASLALRHRGEMNGLGGFEATLIDEALQLTESLRGQSAGPAEPPAPAARDALQLRNRLATLLYERMLRVRAAARFVFRAHPGLIREVGSAYGRKQRAAHRSRKGAPAQAKLPAQAEAEDATLPAVPRPSAPPVGA